MRSGRTQEQLNNVAHKHYTTRLTGDGVKTEFAIGKNVVRVEDLLVFVGGLLKVPSLKGVANDYSIRGVTAGYAGDTNTIKFAAAPANLVDIALLITAD